MTHPFDTKSGGFCRCSVYIHIQPPAHPIIYRIQQQRCQLRIFLSPCREVRLQVTSSYCQCINLDLIGLAVAAPHSEITPRHRAVLVALHHCLPQIGLSPVSFRKIEAILGIPKSTCCNIYTHALTNATRRRPPPPAAQHPEPPQPSSILGGKDFSQKSMRS